jgi:putative ABC transport system substrate-binding protein
MKKMISVLTTTILGVALLAGCSSQPANTSENPEKGTEKIKIGILQPMDHPSLNTIRESIISEIETMGLGDVIEIDYKNANGDASTMVSIANQFVGNKVDMIIPIGTNAAQTTAAATKDIPIVFAAVSYPVDAGLVSDLSVTDANITGVTNAIAIDEIFNLVKTLTPKVKIFGFVYNTGEVNAVSSIDRAKEYCDANGFEYRDAVITNTGELQQTAQSLAGKVDAIFTPNDNMVASAMPVLAAEAIKANLPVYVGADSMVQDGGFASVGIDYTILGKQVARMVKRIAVDNEEILANPVEVVDEYAKLINRTTADSIGIEIPAELLKEYIVLE